MKGFIIDTDSYSGNFERQMCAYVTGHVGDCGKGRSEAEQYAENYKPLQYVKSVEEEGFSRPVAIYPTENVWNNGFGYHFKEGEEKQALQAYQNDSIKYKEKNIKTVENHRGKNLPTWTDEAIDQAIERSRKEIEEIQKETKVEKHPAYQSVLIYIHSEPDLKTIEFMKQRAYEYAAKNNITITEFRTLETTEKTKRV